MDPTTVAAQQTAILELRRRFERGELAYDDFRRGLDALLLAHDPEDCETILRELPHSPLAPLNALDRAVVPEAEPRHQRIVAVLGETKRMRRPWELASSTQVTAVMGEVKLDLTRALLPARASIQITAVMGSVTLYVPSGVRVAVRSRAYLADASLLGESSSGIVAFGHEEHMPPADPPGADLQIEALVVMGSVKVSLADGPVVSLGDLVRDTLRVAVESFRRGLLATPTPPPPNLPDRRDVGAGPTSRSGR
jgi:hypothetical protein